MKASEAKLLNFLKESSQFIIPIYQRTYSWTEKECRQLWDDIIRAGTEENITGHFIGSIVYVEQGLSQVSLQTPLLVIDGQQRLTSISLLIEALARALGKTQPVEGFSADKLRHYYLINSQEDGDRHFKLLLSQTDNDSLKAIIKDTEQPQVPSLRIGENFNLFTKWLDEQAKQKDGLTVICRGLAKLIVVDIALNRDQDNPQLIFESMNSTGKELSQADLIRNFILMGLPPEQQTQLYKDYWRPMEIDFGQAAYGTQFDAFMRHYLTFCTGDIPNEREVYEAFKDYSRTKLKKDSPIEVLIKEIRIFAGYYCAMAFDREQNPVLKEAFRDLRDLQVAVAYPLLLELYNDYAGKRLSADDFVASVRLIEAYVFRRAICQIPSNSMNKTFARFSKALKKDCYLESIQAHFLMLTSYRQFPKDDDFHRQLQIKDIYHFRSCWYLLHRLENHGRKERVEDEYTIEHILPQNPNLSEVWIQELGSEWEKIQQEWLHRLGNLTLTGYNAEYSDRPFSEKRDMTGGFKESPLKLNAGLRQLDAWNLTAIQTRGLQLADKALSVWIAPKLDTARLAAYQPQKEATIGAYSIENHPSLLTGGMREVFEEFRKQVLALDPNVSEEFLKFYVAYKAETNFVDVVPKSKKLKLHLNMSFLEINDPRGLCRDVATIGHWGNGEVELELKSLDELTYVLGLVRQSYERQLG